MNYDLFLRELTRLNFTLALEERINIELYNIKHLFLESKFKLTEIKNALLKLSYIALMGHKIDFGIPQIVMLLNSKSFSDIRIGWMTLIAISPSTIKSFQPVIPILLTQLKDFNNDPVQCIAINVASQLKIKELAEIVGPAIAEIALSPRSSEHSRKKSLIAVARIYQITRVPELVTMLAPALPRFLQSSSLSIQVATATLTFTFMTCQPGAFGDVFPIALQQLSSLFVLGTNKPDTLYYGTPAPFYALQLIRILRFQTNWTAQERAALEQVALALFNRAGECLPVRAAFSYLIVFSELTSLVAMRPLSITTMRKCAETLARYLSQTSTNVIYFSLDSLKRLINTNPNLAGYVSHAMPLIYKHLRNPDVGIASLAVSLISLMGNTKNSKEIVQEFLNFLPVSPLALRNELCAKITHFAQSNPEPAFFSRVIMQLLYEHGEYCDSFIWETAARVIVENQSLRGIAVPALINLLRKNMNHAPVQFVKLTVYCAGLFIERDVTQVVKFIIDEFDHQNEEVQSHMLTAVARIVSRFPIVLTNEVIDFFRDKQRSMCTEVAQRAREYSAIVSNKAVVTKFADFVKMKPNELTNTEISLQIDKLIGVSVFPDEDIDFEMIKPTTEELIRMFAFRNYGTVYEDEFLLISANLLYDMLSTGIVTCSFAFENKALLAIEDFKVDVSVPQSVDVSINDQEIDSTIAINSQTLFNVSFLYHDLTIQMPQLSVSFKVSGRPYFTTALAPILYERMVKEMPMNLQSAKKLWMNCVGTQFKDAFSIEIDPETIIETLKDIALAGFQMSIIPNEIEADAKEAFIAGQSYFNRQKRGTQRLDAASRFLVRFAITDRTLTVEVRSSSEGGLLCAITQLRIQFQQQFGFMPVDEEEELSQ